MNNGFHKDYTLRIGQFQSLAFSLLIHLIVLGFLVIGGVGKKAPNPKEKSEVRFVKLRGGGENRPGWINPSKFAPDKSRIPDDKPAAPRIRPEKEYDSKPDQKEIRQLKQTDSKPKPESSQSNESVVSRNTGDISQSTSTDDAALEKGRGIGRKPGPKGAGTGAISETDFPGGSQYLSRLEAEVQRRFNFHGRKSGVYAEFHFFIDRKGKVRDLVMMKSSEIPSLDFAAKSAIVRSKFPPLPQTYNHPRLGVTYRFYDLD